MPMERISPGSPSHRGLSLGGLIAISGVSLAPTMARHVCPADCKTEWWYRLDNCIYDFTWNVLLHHFSVLNSTSCPFYMASEDLYHTYVYCTRLTLLFALLSQLCCHMNIYFSLCTFIFSLPLNSKKKYWRICSYKCFTNQVEVRIL